MKKSCLSYRVNTHSGESNVLSMPQVCPVCGNKAEDGFTVKGHVSLPSFGRQTRTKVIKVKFPICGACNRKRKNSTLVLWLYHLICGAAWAAMLPFVAGNQDNAAYVILWLLFPVVTGILWTFAISPALEHGNFVLHEFLYTGLNDIPRSVEIMDSNAYRFGNAMFADLFAECNNSSVQQETHTEDSHPVWRTFLSAAYIVCAALILFFVYAFIKGIF